MVGTDSSGHRGCWSRTRSTDIPRCQAESRRPPTAAIGFPERGLHLSRREERTVVAVPTQRDPRRRSLVGQPHRERVIQYIPGRGSELLPCARTRGVTHLNHGDVAGSGDLRPPAGTTRVTPRRTPRIERHRRRQDERKDDRRQDPHHRMMSGFTTLCPSSSATRPQHSRVQFVAIDVCVAGDESDALVEAIRRLTART